MLRLKFWIAGAGSFFLLDTKHRMFAVLYKYIYAINVKRVINPILRINNLVHIR
jgi:hypothetical protein